MTELTTKQIGEQLRRSDLTAAVYQDLIRAIATRRRTIKERLDSIEDSGAVRRAAIESGDSDALVKLNGEAELLDDEHGILYELEPRAFKLHVAATERETVETGQRGHRRIVQVLASAEQALAAYLDARQRLTDATDAIGGANDQQRARIAALGEENAQVERLMVDDATADRILDVMHPPSLVREEQRAGGRAFLRSRIGKPLPQQYGDMKPDYAADVRDRMRR